MDVAEAVVVEVVEATGAGEAAALLAMLVASARRRTSLI